MYKLKLVILFSLFYNSLNSKILIITHVTKGAFIELQYKTLSFFLKEEFEYVVFVDGNDGFEYDNICQICTNNDLRYIDIPQGVHIINGKKSSLSQRHANVIQYSLEKIGYSHDDIIFIIDSDMFLVKPFSIREFLNDCAIGASLRTFNNGIFFNIYPGLIFFDLKKIKDLEKLSLNPGEIDGAKVDTGGESYIYLKNHSDLKIKHFSFVHSSAYRCAKCNLDDAIFCSHNNFLLARYGFNKNELEFINKFSHNIEFFLDRVFLHYKAGSWGRLSRNVEYSFLKINAIKDFINNSMLNDYTICNLVR